MPPYTRFLPNTPPVQGPAFGAEHRKQPVGRKQQERQVGAGIQEKPLNWLAPLLMWSLILPVIINLGPLRLSPNRLILLATVVPLVVMWLSGKAGHIRAADVLVVLSSLWFAFTLILSGGTPLIETAGITGVEMLGPYMMARCLIRSQAHYISLIRTLSRIALVLFPVAALEALTGIEAFTAFADPIFATFPNANDIRWGMERAQTGFEHPILFGCFTAFLFSPIYLSLHKGTSPLKVFAMMVPVLAATFFSLSMGAYLGLFVQIMLIGWACMMRGVTLRWHLLSGLILAAYFLVDVVSNRTPFEVFISYLTFDAHTAYWRVLIFTSGIQNVWANPVFGLGLGDWVRPYFMYTSSVDNFWLLMAMRHGIPGFLLIAASYAAVVTALVRANPALKSVQMHRRALAFSLLGLGVAMVTVHLWNATFVFFMFMLGAGAWMSEGSQEKATPTALGPRGRSFSPRASVARFATAPAASDQTRRPVTRTATTRL